MGLVLSVCDVVNEQNVFSRCVTLFAIRYVGPRLMSIVVSMFLAYWICLDSKSNLVFRSVDTSMLHRHEMQTLVDGLRQLVCW